jgi:hypothetical protein
MQRILTGLARLILTLLAVVAVAGGAGFALGLWLGGG